MKFRPPVVGQIYESTQGDIFRVYVHFVYKAKEVVWINGYVEKGFFIAECYQYDNFGNIEESHDYTNKEWDRHGFYPVEFTSDQEGDPLGRPTPDPHTLTQNQ
ncbi:MAG: hypothetical protein V4443_08535 [Pseudomonadota bacterium]